MSIGIYINGELHSRSKNFDGAKVKAIQFLNEKWEENKKEMCSTQYEYLSAITALVNGNGAKFMGLYISFGEVDEKKYAITYTTTFDECEETCNVEYLSKQIKYVCDEDNAKNIFSALKVDAEDVVSSDVGCFEDLLSNGYVECLSETETEYELYVPSMRQFHIVEIKEIV